MKAQPGKGRPASLVAVGAVELEGFEAVLQVTQPARAGALVARVLKVRLHHDVVAAPRRPAAPAQAQPHAAAAACMSAPWHQMHVSHIGRTRPCRPAQAWSVLPAHCRQRCRVPASMQGCEQHKCASIYRNRSQASPLLPTTSHATSCGCRRCCSGAHACMRGCWLTSTHAAEANGPAPKAIANAKAAASSNACSGASQKHRCIFQSVHAASQLLASRPVRARRGSNAASRRPHAVQTLPYAHQCLLRCQQNLCLP